MHASYKSSISIPFRINENLYANSNDSFSNICPDLFFRVFSNFDPSLLVKLSLVSKHWKLLSEDNELWKKFIIKLKDVVIEANPLPGEFSAFPEFNRKKCINLINDILKKMTAFLKFNPSGELYKLGKQRISNISNINISYLSIGLIIFKINSQEKLPLFKEFKTHCKDFHERYCQLSEPDLKAYFTNNNLSTLNNIANRIIDELLYEQIHVKHYESSLKKWEDCSKDYKKTWMSKYNIIHVFQIPSQALTTSMHTLAITFNKIVQQPIEVFQALAEIIFEKDTQQDIKNLARLYLEFSESFETIYSVPEYKPIEYKFDPIIMDRIINLFKFTIAKRYFITELQNCQQLVKCCKQKPVEKVLIRNLRDRLSHLYSQWPATT